MKRLGNLYHKICDIENIRLAHKMASKDKAHYIEVLYVNEHLDECLYAIQQMLINKEYVINKDSYTIKIINDKGKERELAKLSYYPHRIIQWAIMLVIEKTFSNVFCYHSCASVPNRGIDKAATILFNYLDKYPEETKYCLKVDVKKFYPSINREVLKKMIRKKFKDKDLLWLLDMIIDSCPNDEGIPIGSYMSQYLANFYLAYFDHYMKENLKLKYVIRYMDDIVVLHSDKTELHKIRLLMNDYLLFDLKLTMKENWQVFPVESRGVDFVGFVFFRNYIKVRKRNKMSLIKTVRRICYKEKQGKELTYTDFCSINSRIGFFQYFNHYHLFKKYISPIIRILTKYYRNNIATGKTENEKNKKTFLYKKKIESKIYKHKFIPSKIIKQKEKKERRDKRTQELKERLHRIFNSK